MTDADNAGGYACVWEISAPPQFHCKSRTSLLKINSLKKSESRYDADQRKKQMLAPVLWDASPGGLSLHSSPSYSHRNNQCVGGPPLGTEFLLDRESGLSLLFHCDLAIYPFCKRKQLGRDDKARSREGK